MARTEHLIQQKKKKFKVPISLYILQQKIKYISPNNHEKRECQIKYQLTSLQAETASNSAQVNCSLFNL
jgi:hypothetical protein